MCDPDDDWTAWELVSGLEPMSSIEVEITDNPVVAVLYGPDGDVLVEFHERPVYPFGFGR